MLTYHFYVWDLIFVIETSCLITKSNFPQTYYSPDDIKIILLRDGLRRYYQIAKVIIALVDAISARFLNSIPHIYYIYIAGTHSILLSLT